MVGNGHPRWMTVTASLATATRDRTRPTARLVHLRPATERPHHACITYDAVMRTTVDLPPAVHRRATELAVRTGRSLSAVLADLTVRGLAQIEEPVVLGTDDRTGLPVLAVGRRVTSAEVADLLDDE